MPSLHRCRHEATTCLVLIRMLAGGRNSITPEDAMLVLRFPGRLVEIVETEVSATPSISISPLAGREDLLDWRRTRHFTLSSPRCGGCRPIGREFESLQARQFPHARKSLPTSLATGNPLFPWVSAKGIGPRSVRHRPISGRIRSLLPLFSLAVGFLVQWSISRSLCFQRLSVGPNRAV